MESTLPCIKDMLCTIQVTPREADALFAADGPERAVKIRTHRMMRPCPMVGPFLLMQSKLAAAGKHSWLDIDTRRTRANAPNAKKVLAVWA